MEPIKITHTINEKALQLLQDYPQGLQWSALFSKIMQSDPSFHPKTVNGCIWKLPTKYPNQVYKPAKGLFRLIKYREDNDNSASRPKNHLDS